MGVLQGSAAEATDGILSLGTAEASFGDAGSEGYWVLESEVVDDAAELEYEDDPDDERELRDETLLSALEKVDEVDEARDKMVCVGDDAVAESGVIPVEGICTSFRMTIREICKLFRASRAETYSNAEVSTTGNLLASRSDEPASRG